MTDTKITTAANGIADRISTTADHAIAATQHAATDALDSLADSVLAMRTHAEPVIARATGQATDLLHNSMDSVRSATGHVTEAARHARDGTVGYVRDEPVKAMLIAAATGAALMALISMMGHSRQPG